MNDVVSGWGKLRVEKVTTPEEYARAAKLVRMAEAFMTRATSTARRMYGADGTLNFAGVKESTEKLKAQMAAYKLGNALREEGVTELMKLIDVVKARFVSTDADDEVLRQIGGFRWGFDDSRSFSDVQTLQDVCVSLGIKITNISFEFIDPPPGQTQLGVVSEEREAQAS